MFIGQKLITQRVRYLLVKHSHARFTLVFMHPGGFKKPAVLITRSQWLSVLIEDHNIPGCFCKSQHIIIQQSYFRTKCWFMISSTTGFAW